MPRFIQRLYPERIWAFSRNKNTIYLTFDDGPIPEVTPWVLKELRKYNAKATFFCIGENIEKNTEIYQRILAEGHAVGNHTFNHLNGWQTETADYIKNVEKGEKQMNKNSEFRILNSKLFRPPYGKITSKQSKKLQQMGYKIVMWDVLSYDYDNTITTEKCLQNVLNNLNPGNIIVFHDSLKAEKNLRYVLPKVLAFLSENKLNCESIMK